MTSFVPRQFPVDFLRLDAALRQTLNELEKQQKQQRNAAMVTCRKTKKEKQKRNHSELHHLESQLQHLVESVRVARSSQEQNANETPAEALHGLVADLKLLRLENLALREEIQRYETLRVMLDSEQFREELSQHMTSLWHVGVDQNLPCFHFSRFTRDEVDEAMNQFDLELALSAPALSYAGEFLGWSVHHAPLDVYPSGSTIARVHCHLTLPLEFDQDALVFAHHIPGPNKQLRYIYFAQRTQRLLQDGRRNREFSLSIVSSHGKREAEGLKENVEWVEEGGMHISITEGDDTFVGIVCDRWTSCQNKLQADYNMVQWAQYASWWEQTVAPDSLLL